MSMQWDKFDIPLAAGVDTKSDPKVTTGNIDLENAVFNKAGAITKRYGYTETPTTTNDATPASITAARHLTTRDDELLMADADTLYTYSMAEDAWSDRGTYQSIAVTTSSAAEATSNQTTCDQATVGGVTVYAWEDSRGNAPDVYYCAYDATTGGQILTETSLGAGSKPLVRVCGNNILIIYYDSAVTDLRVKVLRPGDLANSSSEPTIRLWFNDVGSSELISAKTLTDGNDYVVFAYTTSSADNCTARVGYLDHNGNVSAGIGASTTRKIRWGGTDGTHSCLDVVPLTNSQVAVVAHYDFADSGVHVGCYDLFNADLTVYSTGSLVVAPSANQATRIAGYQSGSDGIGVTYELWGANPVNRSVVIGGSTFKGCYLASHAFTLDTDSNQTGPWYVHVAHIGDLTQSYMLVDSNGVVHNRLFFGTTHGDSSFGGPCNSNHLPFVQNTATNEYQWVATTKTRLDSEDNDVYNQTGMKLVKYDFNGKYTSTTSRGICYLGGGQLWQYDGASLTESGFLVFPDGVTAAAAGSGGNLGAGTYQYRVYYEWTNAHGLREQSTAVAISQATSASDEVTLTIPTLKFTNKSNVSIAVYRTLVDGSVYYRVSSLDPTASGDNGYVANDTTADTVSFVDSMSDANAQSNELDYQNTGELDNVPPACPRIVARAGERIWCVSGENPKQVYYSKLAKVGFPAEFNENLYIELPSECTGISYLTGLVVLFTDSEIYVIQGEGPNNTGFGNFSDPQMVAHDVGCKDFRSIVESPQGVVFQSHKGIRLLDKALQTQYIGAPVEDYNAQIITGAEAIEDKNQLRFLTSSGRTLVFDYEFGQWSTFTNHEGTGSCVWRNVYCYSMSDGVVRRENTDYRDGNKAIAMSVTTGWIKPASFQGYFRARRIALLGEYKSNHDLQVKVGYDYETGYRETENIDPSQFISTETWGDDATWGAGNFWGGDGKTQAYYARQRLRRQKAAAIRFKLTDIPGDTAGESLELTSLTLEYGVKRGLNRLASNRSF